MARDKEPFLSRWSRRKLDQAREPEPVSPPAKAEAAPPDLPPVDQLGPDSDYRGFFHPKVDEVLRRQALKKLFASPQFQTPDMMDDFNEDYTVLLEPLAPEAAAKLEHAKRTLFGGEQETKPATAEAPREEGTDTAPTEVARAEEPAPQADPDKSDGAAG